MGTTDIEALTKRQLNSTDYASAKDDLEQIVHLTRLCLQGNAQQARDRYERYEEVWSIIRLLSDMTTAVASEEKIINLYSLSNCLASVPTSTILRFPHLDELSLGTTRRTREPRRPWTGPASSRRFISLAEYGLCALTLNR